MGTIVDCCVSDDNSQLKNDNEGYNNMDTTPNQLLLKQHERSQSDTNFNPSIYTKQNNDIHTTSTSTYTNPREDEANKNSFQSNGTSQTNQYKNKIKITKINLTADPIKQSLSKYHPIKEIY